LLEQRELARRISGAESCEPVDCAKRAGPAALSTGLCSPPDHCKPILYVYSELPLAAPPRTVAAVLAPGVAS